MTRQLIEVNETHIIAGQKGSPSWCPIAMAIKTTFPNSRAIVGKQIWISQNSELGHIYKVPVRAAKFIRDFDKGKKVKPFKFYLERID